MTEAVILGRGRLTFNGLEYSCLMCTVFLNGEPLPPSHYDVDRGTGIVSINAPGGPVTAKELDQLRVEFSSTGGRALPPKKKKAQWKLDPRTRQWGAR